MPEVFPDTKPARRVVASRSEWKRLRALKLNGQPCRVCGGTAHSLHHAIPRSLGGGDVAECLVPVCGDGTTGDHGRLEAMDLDARMALRRSLRPEEVAYIVATKGEDWLSRRYPL